MYKYSIVLFFNSDKTFVQIVDNKTFYFDNNLYVYDTSCIINQECTRLIRIDPSPIVPTTTSNQADINYIHNIITYTFDKYMKNQADTTVFTLFSQYLEYIITDFVEHKQKHLGLLINNCNHIFVTPRMWGYTITKESIFAIFQLATLVSNIAEYHKRVTLYTDLYLNIIHLQQYIFIRSLRNCIYCTFFVEKPSPSDLFLYSNIDVFKAGTPHDFKNVFFFSNYVIPVHASSTPLLLNKVDITRIYVQLKNCLSPINKVHTDFDTLLQHLTNNLKSLDLNYIHAKKHLKEIHPFKDLSYGDQMSNGVDAITMYNIYHVIRPRLNKYIASLQVILKRFKIREVFLDLFPRDLQIDDWYIRTAWISLYILQLALHLDTSGYLRIHFVNSITSTSMTCTNANWQENYRYPIHNFELVKVALKYRDPKFSIMKSHKDHRKQKQGSGNDYLVYLDLGIGSTQLSVYRRRGNSKYKLLKNWENKSMRALNNISNIDCKTYTDITGMNEIRHLESFKQRILKTMDLYFNDIVAKSKESRVEMNSSHYSMIGQSSLLYYPKNKLCYFKNILLELCHIETQSKSQQQQDMFQQHYMKIFLILYIIYIRSKLTRKPNKYISYAIVLDHHLEQMLGHYKSVIREFACQFGLVPDKGRFIVFKKRNIYSLKIQTLPIFRLLPAHASMYQVQITRDYCQISYNKLFLDPKSKRNIPSQDYIDTKHMDFYQMVTDNLWNYIQNALHQEVYDPVDRRVSSLDAFNTFKTQIGDILNILSFELNLNDEIKLKIYESFEFVISFQTLIQVAIIPSIKVYVATVFSSIRIPKDVQLAHVFIILENMTYNNDRFQSIFKHFLLGEIADYCNEHPYYIKCDFSIIDECDIIKKDLLDYYHSGVTQLFRVFHSTYAIKFVQSDEDKELEIYSATASEEKLDLNKCYVIGKANDKTQRSWRGFRINVPLAATNKEFYTIEIYRIDDPNINQYVIDDLTKLEHCCKIGHFDLTDSYLQSDEFKKFPIIRICVNSLTNQPLVELCLATEFGYIQHGSFLAVEPFAFKIFN